MKTWRRIASLVLASALLSSPLGASGVRIEHRLTLEEVVKRVHEILVVEIVRLDHVYNTSPQCAPSAEPFMRTFRAETRVKEVIRGDRTLKGRRVWVLRHGAFVPCRWITLKEYYDDSAIWTKLKPGSSLLAYVSTETLSGDSKGELYLTLLGMDGIDQRSRVLKTLKLPDVPAPEEPPSAPASPPSISSAELKATKAPALAPRASASAAARSGSAKARSGSRGSAGCSLQATRRSGRALQGILVLVLLARLRHRREA
jgi:hypothetical protein